MNIVPRVHADCGRMLLLAPKNVFIPDTLSGVEWNPQRHRILLAELQRLRGRVYLADGAIHRSELSIDGRYIQNADERAWHLITLNGDGEVRGCARYTPHSGPLGFANTELSNSPLCRSGEWASRFQTAVESEIELAKRLGIDYVEVGGWALAPELRCTSEALRMALGAFSMARLLGGCVGLTTATRRHYSSSILRRIGGQSLMSDGIEIPGYFDARYDCEMEILRFHSSQPNPRFERWIEELKGYLSAVPVIYETIHSDLVAYGAPAMTAA